MSIILEKGMFKFSGEWLGDIKDPRVLAKLSVIANKLTNLRNLGVKEMGIVVGGGNIFRGGACPSDIMAEEDAHWVGMSATLVNARALAGVLRKAGNDVKLFTPSNITCDSEHYSPAIACNYLRNGFINIYAGGTGRPGCSTDTAAAEKAYETGASLIKLTNTDNLYPEDPRKFPNQEPIRLISAEEAAEKKFRIMDIAVYTMAVEKGFDIYIVGPDPYTVNLEGWIQGEDIGSKIYAKR